MSASRPSTTSHRTEEPRTSLGWRVWPLVDRVRWGVLAVLALAAEGWLVARLTGRGHLGLLAVGATGLSLWRFFLPVWFELADDGVHQWALGLHRRTPWKAVRGYQVCPRGVLLLSTRDFCRLDAFHGLYLPGRLGPDGLLPHIRHYLQTPPGV